MMRPSFEPNTESERETLPEVLPHFAAADLEGVEENWSVAVEDLLDKGDTDGAISLLESLISKLETLKSLSSDLQLAAALSDLANLYSSRDFSLKADQLQTRAFLIKQDAFQILPSLGDSENTKDKDLAPEASVSAASAGDSSTASDDGDLKVRKKRNERERKKRERER
ncbi:hypothetical protein BVC80_8137g3 [Macleaya cordata]|uniref:Uncharacterized protein n=1 Tax=Macleaya cordata TaxID=56857 RepID=A0A200PUW8_MACCD|nr:hypothetical protein BVC80_8137g3 [Macleaya cordata]